MKFLKLAGMLVACGIGTASAQTYTASSVTAAAGSTDNAVTISYTAGQQVNIADTVASVTNASGRLTNIRFQVFDATNSVFVTCTAPPGIFFVNGGIRRDCASNGRERLEETGGAALPNLMNVFRILFDVPAGATAGTETVSFLPNCGGGQFPPACTEFTDVNAVRVTGTLTPGTITITTGPAPVAPTVSAFPATTLSSGAIGGTATGTVTVNVATAGTAGGSLALNCTIPATGTSNFLITAGATRTINGPAATGANAPAIGLSCVRQATAVTATLSCAQNATPDPDPAALTATITCPAGVAGDVSPNIAFTPNPLTLTGTGTATGTLVGTPSSGTGSATTVATCTDDAGDPTFTITPASRTFTGSATTTQDYVVGCTTAATATSGTITCSQVQSDGTNPAATVVTVNCPMTAAGPGPEFSSAPPAGTTISLNGTVGGTNPTGLVTVTNVEAGTTLIVSAAITGAGLTVTPAGPVNLTGNASQAFTVSCSAATAGTFSGTLTFTTNDPDDGEGMVTFPVTCSIIAGGGGTQATAVPTLSPAGKLIAIFSVLGLGLLGFAVSRRA